MTQERKRPLLPNGQEELTERRKADRLAEAVQTFAQLQFYFGE